MTCIGGSNGRLLVGNLITRPVSSTLFGAAICQVPLLDMKRYSHLLAGAHGWESMGMAIQTLQMNGHIYEDIHCTIY